MAETRFPFPAVPTVESERLVLRGHTLADLDDSLALWGDPEVTRHIGGKPSTREQVWNRLLRYAGHWALMGYGYWVVAEKSGGRFVGEVGLARFERAITPPLGEVPEAGWVIAPWAQGRGYATEAVQASLGWIARERGATRTVCLIDPPNLPSLRVATKAGFEELHRTTYEGEPTIVFARDVGAPLH
jgi:RimJ/RimL family protein N-acetyltransferase